ALYGRLERRAVRRGCARQRERPRRRRRGQVALRAGPGAHRAARHPMNALAVPAGEPVARAERRLALSPRLFVGLLLACLILLIVVPVFVLVIGSFLAEPPRALRFDFTGLTLQNYAEVLTRGGFGELFATTLAAALIGTAGALGIGAGL